jgi:hypothetical protein
MGTAKARAGVRPEASAPNSGSNDTGPRRGRASPAGKAPIAGTPWGPAAVLEEVSVPQRAGDRRFAIVVQLLEASDGDRLIRFAYTTAGSARRGPVTMRARDLERLRAALERAPVLHEVLRI